MKIKKVIAVIAGIAVALSAAVGGVYGYKSYQDKKLVAEVQPVSSLNWGYWGDTETSYGTVTNDSSQEIYLDDSKMIKEVYVEKGDEVQKGDPLLAYDTAELQIEIERKKLDISTIENNIERQKYKYEMLKTQTPVKKDPPKLNEEQLAWYQHMDEENRLTETDKNDGRIYNYLTAASIPYNVTTNAAGELVYPAGTAEEPYIYYVNQNAYAYGGFFNAIRPTAEGGRGKHVRVIVCKKDADGKMVLDTDEATGRQTPVADDTVSPNTIELNGSDFPADYDESRMWYLFSGKEYIPTSLADEYMQAYEDFMADWEVPKGYTSEELYQEAAEIEEKLKTLDIQRRQEQLALESMEKSATDGVVYAEVDGVVKTLGDPDEKPEQGQAFLVITGDDGLYVKGTISELLLDDVKMGTVVTANSWESGMTFDATITEISDYPVSGNSWGDGNPNVSYYEYTAYIEDSSALRNGEAVDLSISTNQSDGGGIFIEKAYVRSEDGKSYCMIADENNRLKKQYVVTGRTVYGSAVEIKSGLTEDDRIAFPYGKNAVEGAAVTDESSNY